MPERRAGEKRLIRSAALIAFVAAFVLLSLGAGRSSAQTMPWQKDAQDASHEGGQPQSVEFLFPEQISVPAGKDSMVELHFRVKPGMHVNSHQPHEKGLIPTQLIVAEDGSIDVTAVDFPAGADFALPSMPSEKVSVYTGEFVLRAHVKASAGNHMLQAALRYQACDDRSCYPPRKAPVAINVVAR